MIRAFCTAAAILVLAGCSGEETPDGGLAIGLLDRLAATNTPGATVVDVRQVREKLGVGAIDPRKAYDTADPAQRRFATIFATALPLLGLPYDVPALAAIDLSRVTAVAHNGPAAGRKRVVVLATEQPFNEVAGALQAAGYSRDGALLRKQNPARTAAASAVAGGSGVIAIGEDADAVRTAAEGRATGIRGLARDLLAELNAPTAVVIAPGQDCPKAIAIADDLDGGRARLVVVADSPQVSRLTATQPDNTLFSGLTFDSPSIDGDRLTTAFTYPQNDTSDQPLPILGEASGKDIYDCDQ